MIKEKQNNSNIFIAKTRQVREETRGGQRAIVLALIADGLSDPFLAAVFPSQKEKYNTARALRPNDIVKVKTAGIMTVPSRGELYFPMTVLFDIEKMSPNLSLTNAKKPYLGERIKTKNQRSRPARAAIP